LTTDPLKIAVKALEKLTETDHLGRDLRWPYGHKAYDLAVETLAEIARLTEAQPQPPDVPETIYKAVERVLDENSAWIARPNADVTRKVAMAAGIAWSLHAPYDLPELQPPTPPQSERTDTSPGVVGSQPGESCPPAPADIRAINVALGNCDPLPPAPATLEFCRANRDGDCTWQACPQLRDDEPRQTGRHCPLDND
jgi:hypothetical protein